METSAVSVPDWLVLHRGRQLCQAHTGRTPSPSRPRPPVCGRLWGPASTTEAMSGQWCRFNQKTKVPASNVSCFLMFYLYSKKKKEYEGNFEKPTPPTKLDVLLMATFPIFNLIRMFVFNLWFVDFSLTVFSPLNHDSMFWFTRRNIWMTRSPSNHMKRIS